MEMIKTKDLELIILDLNFSIDTSGREGMDPLSKIRGEILLNHGDDFSLKQPALIEQSFAIN